MNNNLTREQIEKAFLNALEQITLTVHDDYLSACDKLDKEQKDNPLLREMLAISIAQSNAVFAVKDALCELLLQE